VQVFGRCVEPGQLIHADQHGFLAIPKEDEQGLLEATSLMDRNECETVIAAARSPDVKGLDDRLNRINEAAKAFGQRVVSRTKRSSEWR
jgi:regulator of RNase E activity RraA